MRRLAVTDGDTLDRPIDVTTRMARSGLFGSVPGVIHGITSRVDGLGLADGNAGYGAPRDQDDAWAMRQRWCAALGLNPHHLTTAHQTHGAAVIEVSAHMAGQGALPGSAPVGAADALITRDPGVALMTLHADCLPILLVDPDAPAVAAVHAGWRGTVMDVAGATIAAMTARFLTRPEHVLAFLGPAIGACCFEIGDEVVEAWQRQAGDGADIALRNGQRRSHLDLRAANRLLLMRAGLHDERIDESLVCTRCDGQDWFSHRGQGAGTGRFGAIIALAGAVSGG